MSMTHCRVLGLVDLFCLLWEEMRLGSRKNLTTEKITINRAKVNKF